MKEKLSGNRFSKHPFLTLLGLNIGIFLFTEILLRIINPQVIEFAYNFRRSCQYDSNWYVDLRPNITSTVRLSAKSGISILNFLITTNEYGFRCPDRILDTNVSNVSEGITYIHAIGDSFTMGWGVNYDASYPEILDFMLDEKARVLNLGVNGFGIIAATEKSMKLWNKFPARHVLYLFWVNDFDDDLHALKNQNRGRMYHLFMYTLDFCRHNSYVATLPFALSWWLYYRHGDYNATQSDLNPHKTIYQDSPWQFKIAHVDTTDCAGKAINPSMQALLNYKKFLDEQKSRLTVFIPYFQGSVVSKQMYHFCSTHSIEVLLFEVPAQLKLIKEGHFNKLGNYRLAQMAYDIIKNPRK